MAVERKYSDEIRTATVQEVLRRRSAEPGNRSIIREVSEQFGVGHQSLRQWLARYDDGSYSYPAETPEPHAAEPPDTGPKSKAELVQEIAELRHRITVLEDDNRSLTRSLALLAEDLRREQLRSSHSS